MPRLVSIRSRILALAVLGTVIPAAISLGVAYRQNRRAREDKITQQLVSEGTQSAGAMGVWLKERLYDLRVFATSDEVSNNLSRSASTATVTSRLREYLRSLHERFTDFDQLLVIDPNGRVVASSAQGQTAPVPLPDDWQKTLRQQGQLIGNATWDEPAKKGKLMVIVPVQRADGKLLGGFAAEISLAPMNALLRSFAYDSSTRGPNGVYLINDDGSLIVSSRAISPEVLKTKMKPGVLERLSRNENSVITYAGLSGVEVVGTYKRVPRIPWAVVAELSADEAFRQVRSFRNAALLVVFVLLLIVGATAFYLGNIIVRPLHRLATAAAEVSGGDLSVDLPETGGGEVGALTTVFNYMVRRLRAGREELERLSVTDGLTGLTNHRAMQQRLSEESMRAGRNKRPFCVVMIDVDHFKSYNDNFGHPAGDVVLKRVAALLKESTRTIDCCARYGGEEFSLLLPETDKPGAIEVAERVRRRVEQEDFPERKVTVSIGLAEFPSDIERGDGIIAIADAALYEAKHSGRNKVVAASKSTHVRKSSGAPVQHEAAKKPPEPSAPSEVRAPSPRKSASPAAVPPDLPSPKPRPKAKKKD